MGTTDESPGGAEGVVEGHDRTLVGRGRVFDSFCRKSGVGEGVGEVWGVFGGSSVILLHSVAAPRTRGASIIWCSWQQACVDRK